MELRKTLRAAPCGRLNERGQASIFDALIFLTICAGLATLLFTQTINYGKNETQELSFRYLRAYSSSVYKALLWAPANRNDPACSAGGAPASLVQDFLLAYTKERFAVNGGSMDPCVEKLYAKSLASLTDSVKRDYEYLYAVSDATGSSDPQLVLYKAGRPTGALGSETVTLSGCNAARAPDLEEFVNSASSLTTVEGLITLPPGIDPATGSPLPAKAYKTLLLMWPVGKNGVNSDPSYPSTPLGAFAGACGASGSAFNCTKSGNQYNC